jgi:hypothetical protein
MPFPSCTDIPDVTFLFLLLFPSSPAFLLINLGKSDRLPVIQLIKLVWPYLRAERKRVPHMNIMREDRYQFGAVHR